MGSELDHRSRVGQAHRDALAPNSSAVTFDDGIYRANVAWFMSNDRQSAFAEKRVRGLTHPARLVCFFRVFRRQNSFAFLAE